MDDDVKFDGKLKSLNHKIYPYS